MPANELRVLLKAWLVATLGSRGVLLKPVRLPQPATIKSRCCVEGQVLSVYMSRQQGLPPIHPVCPAAPGNLLPRSGDRERAHEDRGHAAGFPAPHQAVVHLAQCSSGFLSLFRASRGTPCGTGTFGSSSSWQRRKCLPLAVLVGCAGSAGRSRSEHPSIPARSSSCRMAPCRGSQVVYVDGKARLERLALRGHTPSRRPAGLRT